MTRHKPDWSLRVIWYGWTARWGWLLLAAVLLAWQAEPSTEALAAVSLYGLAQLSLTPILFLHIRPAIVGWVGLILDFLAPVIVLVLSGGQPWALWILLLAPTSTLSLSFGPWLGFGAGLLAGLIVASLWLMPVSSAGLELVDLARVALPSTIVLALTALAADWIGSRKLDGLAVPLTSTPEVPSAARELAHQLPATELPTDGEQLLRDTLDLGLEVLTATGLKLSNLSGVALYSDQSFLREVGRQRLQLDERLVLTVDEGALAEAWKRGVIKNVPQAEKDPVLGSFASLVGWGSAACLPIDDGKRCLGILVFGHVRRSAFSAEKLEGLHALGQQARLVLRFAELYQEQVQERDRMDEIQEEARKKLARDLHDGPTQVIAAIAMRTNFARRQLSRDPTAADQELEKVENMARMTTKEIRHMLFTLRPLILESQGLVAALRQFADKVEDTHDQRVLVSAESLIEAHLTQASQVALFYIVEEAVTNAQKHAAAEHIWVNLAVTNGDIVAEIIDDGVGFNVGEVDAHYEQRGSLGIVTMRERTELMEGTLEILSQQGQGTTIRVSIPSDQTLSVEGSL